DERGDIRVFPAGTPRMSPSAALCAGPLAHAGYRPLYHASRRRGGSMAARGARAAAGSHTASRHANGLASDDVQQHVELAAFSQELQKLGWTDGHNIQIYYRSGTSDSDQMWTSKSW